MISESDGNPQDSEKLLDREVTMIVIFCLRIAVDVAYSSRIAMMPCSMPNGAEPCSEVRHHE